MLGLLPHLAAASRDEPGNLGYEICHSTEDPRHVILLERYVSRDALDAHRETSHFKELALGRIIPLLADRTVELYEPAD